MCTGTFQRVRITISGKINGLLNTTEQIKGPYFYDVHTKVGGGRGGS